MRINTVPRFPLKENNPVSGQHGISRRGFLSASALTALAAHPILRKAAPALAAPAGLPTNTGNFDPNLRALLAQIDPSRIQATIQKLISFGTRHTASSQTDPVRGIGAATAWVFAQMQAIAATSNGNMTVQQQTFVQPVSSRIPVPTTITNCIATLQGTASPAVLRGHRALGLPGDRRAGLHRQRARCRR